MRSTISILRIAHSLGIVEVVCREVIRGIFALVSMLKLGLSAWPRLISAFQSILNNHPSPNLGKLPRYPGSFSRNSFYDAPRQQPPLRLATLRRQPLYRPRLEQGLSPSAHAIQSKQLKIWKPCTCELRLAPTRDVTHFWNSMHKGRTSTLLTLQRRLRFSWLPSTTYSAQTHCPVVAPSLIHRPQAAPRDCQRGSLNGKRRESHAARLKINDDWYLNVTEELTQYLEFQNSLLLLVEELKMSSAPADKRLLRLRPG